MHRNRNSFVEKWTGSAILFTLVALGGCHRGGESMSPQEQQHAIALLRDAYAAFNRNDIPAAVANFDPNIEWTEPTEFPDGGSYHGQAEVARYLTQSRAGWTEGSSQPVDFIVRGHRIVVYVHAKFRTNGPWTDVSLADVYTFRNGTPIAMRAFADRIAALQWANGTKP